MGRAGVMCVIGTRPEAIKMMPIILELRARGIDHLVVASGQHRLLIDQVFDVFGIKPDFDLNVMQHDQSLSGLTARCLEKIDALIGETDPACVVAQGDTTTVFCAALASFYRNIPFAHVEAGLRSHDMHSPFPEEFNRVAAGRLGSLHFAPTRLAADTLNREGIPSRDVLLTGNTVIDAIEAARTRVAPLKLDGFGEYALITVHRRENFGEGVRRIAAAVRTLADEHPDFGFLWPVHPNPNIGTVVRGELGAHPNVKLVEPLAYMEFVAALAGCAFALSDSGGVQEEAPSLGTPVLVLRTETERPEGIDAGAAKLVGTDYDDILAESRSLIADERARQAMRVESSPYGDGKAAARIVDALTGRYLSGA